MIDLFIHLMNIYCVPTVYQALFCKLEMKSLLSVSCIPGCVFERQTKNICQVVVRAINKNEAENEERGDGG